jgi:hypothetical protein
MVSPCATDVPPNQYSGDRHGGRRQGRSDQGSRRSAHCSHRYPSTTRCRIEGTVAGHRRGRRNWSSRGSGLEELPQRNCCWGGGASNPRTPTSPLKKGPRAILSGRILRPRKLGTSPQHGFPTGSRLHPKPLRTRPIGRSSTAAPPAAAVTTPRPPPEPPSTDPANSTP